MINQDADLAEYIAAQSKREIAQHPRTDIQIRADFARNGFYLEANGEPIGKVYSQFKHALLARDWLARECA